MSSTQNPTNAVEFFAPKLFRVLMPVGALCAVTNAVMSAYQLASGNFSLQSWLGLVSGGGMSVWLGWFGYASWRYPVVRVTSTDIQLRPIGRRVCQRLPAGEVTGLRWQDSFDLRLQVREGQEYSIQMRQIARKDRARMVDVLATRTDAGRPG